MSFGDFVKELHKVFRGASQNVANVLYENIVSNPLSFISEEEIAKRAGVSERTVSQVIRLLKKAGLLIACRRYMTTNIWKAGSYFRFYAKESLSHVFPALAKKTAYYFKFGLISSCIITHINVINTPLIYKSIRSTSLEQSLRSSKEQFSDPPPPKTVPFLPQGAKHNESLLKQAIAKKERNEMTVSLDEATYKLNSYVKMQQQATHQAVIDLCNREIPKWRAIIYKLSNNGE